MPIPHQHIGNPLLTRFLNVCYVAGVSDAYSGFHFFTCGAYETTGIEFALEIIIEAGAKR
ncbi:hypothetical protein G6M89_20785 [Natronolimnobius sp. AArcel1]|uniref:hypothetical protein n=1 Tax=Natronolimnobius sp. AArcel1 TaxID=1679093 RepID=UPI0013EDAE87|nr:hypothetical protein [Natronolimnobius sp. AArcel1]NGM71399.1 hypothetical protein [Natronolimnobius sp. AArcel1]